MGKWGKWALLLVVAMAFAVPAWAVDLKLGGKYEIQGRYYNYQNIKSVDEPTTANPETNPVTTMYLKHYFNLYPTLQVNDKISVKGDIEVFDNRISKSDSYHGYDKTSRAAMNVGGTYDAGVDYYSLFTVNELYVDALTPVGKFILGKTNKFDGIGWFIQLPDVPGWTFGLVWNKLNEAADPNSYYGYTAAGGGLTAIDGTDNAGTKTNHDLGDEDDFALIANYAKDAIDFKGTLAYKMTGKDNCQTSIWVPYFYLNYAVNNNLTFNSKFGYGTGVLVAKDSRVAKEAVAEFEASALEGLAEETAAGAAAFTTATLGYAQPDPWDEPNYSTWNGTYAAVYAASYGPNAADVTATFGGAGLAKDLEVDNSFTVWLGMGLAVDALKIQADAMYLSGANAPNKVSSYAEDYENLDTWLMNDVADLYSVAIQTPATIEALLVGGKRSDGRGSMWDGQFSYANAWLARLNLAYKFTPKLDGNLNLVYAQMANTDYLKKWNTQNATMRSLNNLDPDAMKVGGTGIQTIDGLVLVEAPTEDYDVKADMGWEARARLNYALLENMSVGLDLCYYQPGKLYKNIIETGMSPDGTETGNKMQDTYAARWKATIKF
jgi:hypothetical protein